MKTINWKEMIKEFNASGQSARSFAKEKNFNYHTLRYHIKKESESAGNQKEARIVPLPLASGSNFKMNAGAEIKIAFEEAGSVTIRISGL